MEMEKNPKIRTRHGGDHEQLQLALTVYIHIWTIWILQGLIHTCFNAYFWKNNIHP